MCRPDRHSANRTGWSASQIPDQSGRVAVITGANSGIGLATAAELAAHGADVVLAVRDSAKGEAAAALIRQRTPDAGLSVQALDLASLESIELAAAEIASSLDRVDLLINNGGVMGGPRATTRDGFEKHMGTNHLGHFALTGLLLGPLLSTPGSRIITVSSAAHKLAGPLDPEDLQSQGQYSANDAYAKSKLANLLFTYELHDRLAVNGSSAIALAAHPGGSRSDLSRHSSVPVRMFNKLLQSPAQGALSTLRAATDPTAVGGQFFGPAGIFEAYGPPKVVRSSRQSHDHRLRRRVWAMSEELTGVSFASLPATVSFGE